MERIGYRVSKKLRGKWYRFVHGNHFGQSGDLVADRNTKFIFQENSKINIAKKLTLNGNCICNNGRSSIIRLDENAIWNIHDDACVYYGADIIIFRNAVFTMGNSFINSDCKIRCHSSITIGDDCAISHEFLVMDSDAHYLNGYNNTKAVQIGNHVWIGTRVTILSGVTIGDGAVIAAGSLVKDDVAPGTLVAGVPAKVIKERIEWRL